MSLPPNKWDTTLLGTECLGYELSWYRCCLRIGKSWNGLLRPTTFIHNYKNQIILHINIDFRYKATYNYHSLHDYMSLNQNDDWCLSASRSIAYSTLKLFLPLTGFLDTEIAPAFKPTPPKKKNKAQNVDTKYRLLMDVCGCDLFCSYSSIYYLFRWYELILKLVFILFPQGTDLSKSTTAALVALNKGTSAGHANPLTSLVTALPNQGILAPYEKIPIFFRFSPR